MGYNIYEDTQEMIKDDLVKIKESLARDREYIAASKRRGSKNSPFTVWLHPRLRRFIQKEKRFSQEEILEKIANNKIKRKDEFLKDLSKTEKELTKEEKEEFNKIEGKTTHEIKEIKTDEDKNTLWEWKYKETLSFILWFLVILFTCVLWELNQASFKLWRVAMRTMVFSIGSFNLYRLISYWASDLNATNRNAFWHIINVIPFLISLLSFLSGDITTGAMCFFLGLSISLFMGYWKIKVGITIILTLMFTVIIWNASIFSDMINTYANSQIQGKGLQSIIIARWLSIFLLGIFEIIINLKVLSLSFGVGYLLYQLFTLDEMFDRNYLRNN